ncbi:MAG: helix-turn-helix domain-containing protein [Thermacetogeniaceae bacterium]|jgi:predicted transcriptional regulator
MKRISGKIRDIQRQKEEKKQLQKEMFRQVYNRPKEKDFSDIDQLNMDSFRAIPKSVILDYGLSKAALAVYPVLCCEADFEKDEAFHISQKNIVRFAGVSENTVRNALKELENAGLLIKEKVTDGPRHFYVYKVCRPESEANEQCGEAINFYTCIIENGIWASLPLGAKAIYLFLRAEAKQDFELYSVIEWEVYERDWTGLNYDDYIRNRKWDICETSLTKISRAVGVDRSKIGAYLEALERFKLIERVDRWIMVYLRPGRLLRHKTLV